MKYKTELKKLQAELVQMQRHVKDNKLKVLIIFEGRDAAGKGGVISRITEKLNPNWVRVVSKSKPTEDELKQWYFERWIPDLPKEGEIVLFDRSWYNRAGVESVMGFATEEQVTEFLEFTPEFERSLVKQGIILIKYWLSITQRTQEQRFHERLNDPTKHWKLSPMDLESRYRWHEYTAAKERMFETTHTEDCPWYVIDTNNKKRGRLDCIKHILSIVPYNRKDYEPRRLPPIEVAERQQSFEDLRIN
jgi:polyphosphate kinase 2